MAQVIQHPSTGMYYRPGTLDEYVEKEQRSYRLLYSGRRVLDLGGHIGYFARYALARDAAMVWSYEALPENFNLLCRNMAGLDCIPAQFAVTDNPALLDKGQATFYVNGKRNTGSNTLHPTRGRETVIVPVLPFAAACQRANPETVKVDIEGGEYWLDWKQLPASVTSLAIEFHFNKPGFKEQAQPIDKLLLSMGFTHVRAPVFHTKAWYSLGLYSR